MKDEMRKEINKFGDFSKENSEEKNLTTSDIISRLEEINKWRFFLNDDKSRFFHKDGDYVDAQYIVNLINDLKRGS